MSTVDQRIVEMRFDNEQFERGVRESLKTLDKLKLGLDLDASAKSLENLEKSVGKFTMDSIGDSAVRTAESFSMLYRVGSAFLERLAGSAVDAGIKMAKALSIDNITAGFSKYEQQTKAVQTILNNVEGSTIKDTSALIEKLMWYTDETSYSFDSMISNIGKFTSAGIDLDTASKSMIGIANACGLAGVEASQASHAMDGFSKSMAAGYMSYQNWSWIKTAGLDTKIFKEQLIDAAVELGKLKVDNKGVIRTAKKTEVTYANLTNTLAEKWLDTDVMNEALGRYADYTDEIYKIAKEEGISASEAMELYGGEIGTLGEKAFKAAQEARTFSDAIASVKDAVSSKMAAGFDLVFGNYEEAKKTWTALANYLWEVFAYPFDRINESLKSWKESGGFDSLFGDGSKGEQGAFYNYLDAFYAYTEAAEEVTGLLFFDHEEGEVSNLARAFLNLSDRIKEASIAFQPTNEQLDRFATNIARVFSVIKSGYNILSAIGTMVGKTFRLLKAGVAEIFPDLDEGVTNAVESLSDFSSNIREMAESFEYSEETVQRVRYVFRGLFTVFEYGVNVFKGFWRIGKRVFGYIGPALKSLGKAFDYCLPYIDSFLLYLGEQIDAFVEWADNVDLVETAIGFISRAFQKGKEILGDVSDFFVGVFNNIADGIQALTGYDIRTITWEDILGVLQSLGETLKGLVPLLWDGARAIAAFTGALVSNGVTKAAEMLANLGIIAQDTYEKLKSVFSKPLTSRADGKTGGLSAFLGKIKILEKVKEIAQKVSDKLSQLFENFTVGGGILAALAASFVPLNIAFANAAIQIGGFFVAITSLGSSLKKFVDSLRKANMLKAIVFGFVAALVALTAAIGYLAYVAQKENGIQALNAAKDAIVALLIGMSAFALVVSIASKIADGSTLQNVFLSMAGMMAAFAVLIFAMNRLKGIKLGQGADTITDGLWAMLAILVIMGAVMTAINKLNPTMNTKLWQVIAFAGAIYVLARSLQRLDGLNLDPKVIYALAGCIVAFLLINGVLDKAKDKLKGSEGKSMSLFAAFAALVLAFIGIAYALKMLSSVKDNVTTITGLAVVISVIIFVMLGISYVIGQAAPTIAKGVAMFAGLAGSILLLALALVAISYAPIDAVWKAFGVIVALSLLAILLGGLSKYLTGIGNIGISFLALAASVVFLALGLKMLAGLDVQKAATALTIVMIAFGIMEIFGSLGAGVRGAPKAIIAFASSVLLLALALGLLSFLPDENIDKLKKVAWGLMIAMVALGAAFLAASKLPKKGVLGPMIAMVAFIGVFAAAIYVLKDIPWQSITASAGALVVGLIALAAALAIISKGTKDISGWKILGIATALVIASAAMWVMAQAIGALASYNFSELISPVVALVVAIGLLGVVMKVIGDNAGHVFLGALALAFLAVVIAAVAAAYLAFQDARNGTNMANDFVDNLKGLFASDKEALNEGNELAQNYHETADEIRDGQRDLSDAMSGSGLGAPAGAKRNAINSRNLQSQFGDALLDGFGSTLRNGASVEQYQALLEGDGGVYSLVSYEGAKEAGEAAGKGIPDGIMSAVQNYIPTAEGGMDYTQILSMLGIDGASLTEGGTDITEMLASGISLGKPAVDTSVETIAQSAGTTLEEAATDAVTKGRNFSEGFANGIDNGSYLAQAAAERLALRALSKLSMTIQEGSPSKLTYITGGYFEEGFSNAITDYAYRSENAARLLGADTLQALGEGLGRMDGIANGTIATAPTIRPVLDARAIQNGSRSLDTMFASRQAMYANIADQERRNSDDMYVLVEVGKAILEAVNSGHDLYLDDHKLVGRINRGLGRR